MAQFKAFTESDVTFSFEIEPEDMSPEGHFASGDDEQDATDVADILARLNRGDETAWFCLKVTATAPDGTEATDYLGGVSLAPCPMSGRAVARRVEEFARDSGMHLEALSRLNSELRAAHTPRTVRMCETKYLEPTDHRGSRVRARHITTRRCATLSWDHALNPYENHAAAAELVLGRQPEFSSNVDGGGYIFGCDPANDPQNEDK